MIGWLTRQAASLSRRTALRRLQQSKDWPSLDVADFIVSFPKCGRTWLRSLLAVALARHHGVDPGEQLAAWLDSDLVDIDGREVMFTHALSQRMQHSAADMALFAERIGSTRRLLLIRDPRDAVVSYFFQRTKRPFRSEPPGMPREMGPFIRDPRVGIDRIIAFMNVWAEAGRHVGPFLCLAYEDLHRDPHDCLERALGFFGVDSVERSCVEEAVRFSAFGNMRRIELSDEFVQSKKLRAHDPSDEQSFKTRKGRIGSYVDDVSPDEIGHIEERIANSLSPDMGYRVPGEPPACKRSTASG